LVEQKRCTSRKARKYAALIRNTQNRLRE